MARPAASSAARLMRKPEESFSSDLLIWPSVTDRLRYALSAAMLLLTRRPMVSSLDVSPSPCVRAGVPFRGCASGYGGRHVNVEAKRETGVTPPVRVGVRAADGGRLAPGTPCSGAPGPVSSRRLRDLFVGGALRELTEGQGRLLLA